MSTARSSGTPPRQSPGKLLAQELDSRGWTQAEFAAVVGRPTQFVSEIVTGKKEITRESAAQLGAALGTYPEFWLRLQDRYLLRQQAKDTSTQQALSEVRRRARLHELAPIGTLRKRGVLTGTNLDELERQVMDLFEIDDIDKEPDIAIAARRSNHSEPVSPTQMAWVACVRRAARARDDVDTYSKKKLELLASELPKLLKTPKQFRNLPVLFAAAGVSLIYVEAFPGAKIDGCSFMLEKMSVVGISGRGKRLDKILFTLLHEAAHIALGHVKSETIVETIDPHDKSSDETAANERASKWLLPTPLLDVPPRINASWVRLVASQHDLAPIVVVGQLQNEGVLDWRTALAKNAPSVGDELEAW